MLRTVWLHSDAIEDGSKTCLDPELEYLLDILSSLLGYKVDFHVIVKRTENAPRVPWYE